MTRGFRITTLIGLLAAMVAAVGIGYNTWLIYSDRVAHTEKMVENLVRHDLRDRIAAAFTAGRTGEASLRQLSRTLHDSLRMADVPPFVAMLDAEGRYLDGRNIDPALRELISRRDVGGVRGLAHYGDYVILPERVSGFDGTLLFGFDKADVRSGVWKVTAYTALVVFVLLVVFVAAVRLLLHYRLERPFSDLLQSGMTDNLEEAVAGLEGDAAAAPPDTSFLPPGLAHQVVENFQMLELWRRNKAHLERLLSFGIRETDKQELLHFLEQSLRDLFGVARMKVSEVNASQNRLEPVYSGGRALEEEFPEELLSEAESCFVYRTGSLALHSAGNELCRWCHCNDNDLVLCLPLVGGGQEIGICSIVLDRQALEEKVPMAWGHQRKVRLVESFLRPYLNLVALTLNSINMQDAYKNRAITDGLTGLYNRRYAVEYLSNMVNIAKRSGNSVGVLVVDIDWFKRFNDEYGHKTGDRVLEQVAHAMRAAVRDGDLVARYGGEEFIVVLPDADLDAAGEIGERIRAAVSQIEWDEIGLMGIPPVTISLGLAMFPEHGYSHYHLINAADKALYAAKNAGKNRVTVHNHLPEADDTALTN